MAETSLKEATPKEPKAHKALSWWPSEAHLKAHQTLDLAKLFEAEGLLLTAEGHISPLPHKLHTIDQGYQYQMSITGIGPITKDQSGNASYSQHGVESEEPMWETSTLGQNPINHDAQKVKTHDKEQRPKEASPSKEHGAQCAQASKKGWS